MSAARSQCKACCSASIAAMYAVARSTGGSPQVLASVGHRASTRCQCSASWLQSKRSAGRRAARNPPLDLLGRILGALPVLGDLGRRRGRRPGEGLRASRRCSSVTSTSGPVAVGWPRRGAGAAARRVSPVPLRRSRRSRSSCSSEVSLSGGSPLDLLPAGHAGRERVGDAESSGDAPRRLPRDRPGVGRAGRASSRGRSRSSSSSAASCSVNSGWPWLRRVDPVDQPWSASRRPSRATCSAVSSRLSSCRVQVSARRQGAALA